eukprot:2688925-Lingulodinium_polyedra.AAC.1
MGVLGVGHLPPAALEVRTPGQALLQANRCSEAKPVLERSPKLLQTRLVRAAHVERDEFGRPHPAI